MQAENDAVLAKVVSDLVVALNAAIREAAAVGIQVSVEEYHQNGKDYPVAYPFLRLRLHKTLSDFGDTPWSGSATEGSSTRPATEGPGAQLRAERLHRNLSLRDVADASGVSASTIYRIESGAETSYSNIVAVAQACGVGCGLMYCLEPNPTHEDEDVGAGTDDLSATVGRHSSVHELRSWTPAQGLHE